MFRLRRSQSVPIRNSDFLGYISYVGCVFAKCIIAFSNRLLDLAIDGHRAIGPGLLETVCQACMCMELADAGIPFQSQVMLPVRYKRRWIPLGLFPMGLSPPGLISP